MKTRSNWEIKINYAYDLQDPERIKLFNNLSAEAEPPVKIGIRIIVYLDRPDPDRPALRQKQGQLFKNDFLNRYHVKTIKTFWNQFDPFRVGKL